MKSTRGLWYEFRYQVWDRLVILPVLDALRYILSAALWAIRLLRREP